LLWWCYYAFQVVPAKGEGSPSPFVFLLLFVNMRLSYYLKTYPFPDKPGFSLFYSTKKGSVTLLKEDALSSIGEKSLPPKDEELLLRLGIIVPDREAEVRDVHTVLERINENNDTLNITVLPNLDCNFACTYCYEGEMKGRLYMNEETRTALVAFIKERFRENTKCLNIDFFGGEPLLSIIFIRSLSAEMKSFAESRGAAYTFTLTTNGSLFRRDIAEELVRLGLTTAKITLDGPPEVHNRCRPFRTGRGSFDIIIRNIKETCDVVKTGLGGNFTKENYLQFPKLLDYLQNEGLTPERICQIKFDPVMPGPADDKSKACLADACMSINEPWLIEAGAFLREEILRRGYSTPKIQPSLCQVESTDYYVVNYDGLIYKCPGFIGRKGFEIGSLKEGIRDYSETYRIGIYKNPECRQCEYLPLCFGGCKYMAYIRDGNIDNPDCKRPYLDACLETMIKQDIRYRKQ